MWFYAEPCRAEKPAQADKENMLWTELVRGCLAAHLIHNPIYKSKHGVCLFVCGDKQGRAGRPGQTLAHSRSFSVMPGKATVMVSPSVCVGSAWKILPVIARSSRSFPRCNFPRCNWLQRKNKSGAVGFFETKDLIDQKKIFRPWTAQSLFCFFFNWPRLPFLSFSYCPSRLRGRMKCPSDLMTGQISGKTKKIIFRPWTAQN